jgi:hypothetical protein
MTLRFVANYGAGTEELMWPGVFVSEDHARGYLDQYAKTIGASSTRATAGEFRIEFMESPELNYTVRLREVSEAGV